MLSYSESIAELVSKHAIATPDKIAIRSGAQTITYSELCIKSNQIANWMKQQGIECGDIIVIFIKSTFDLVVLELAIIQLGAIYVSLDIHIPIKRINTIIADADPKLVITDSNFKVPDKFARVNLKSLLEASSTFSEILEILSKHSPSDPISIFYTSGSTGKPKGVIISSQAVINLANTVNIHHYLIDVIAQFNNPAFDPSLLEIWGALLNGITLFIVPYDVKQNLQLLGQTLTENKVKLIVLPTAYLHQLISATPNTLDSVPIIYFGGEQVNPLLLKKFLNYRSSHSLPVTLVNNYGPTEATAVTCHKIINTSAISNIEQLSSIGKPIANVQVYILDKYLQPVKCSETGELYISGIGLALGYHNLAKLNQERFIHNPFCVDNPLFSRLYKTGDLVKQLPTGDLLYVGRIDDQVKIDGFRVHLCEIENQLLLHPNIESAVAIADKSENGRTYITAYIVFSSQNLGIHADDITEFLAMTLPKYMIPTKYIQLDNLPLTPIGKIDKKRLKDIPQVDLDAQVYDSKFSDTENKLQVIWKDMLNRNTVDIYRNLFELGANSLILAESCSRINEVFKSSFSIAEIISNPSIHKLANFIDNNWNNQVPQRNISERLDIAIIGFSCRFPQADSWIEYWDNLCQGRECITNFSDEVAKTNIKSSSLDNLKFVPARGVISNVGDFDAAFFGFSPADASITDPQQRIMLEGVWEALEHSGNIPNKSSNKIISVIAGMADSSYLQENLLKSKWFNQYNDWFNARIATSIGSLSTQISYRLNLNGKSVNINTACSTGLVAVEQACRELMSGSCDIGIACSVSIDMHNRYGYFYKENGIESIDGKCKPFAEDASGTVFSDGAGVIVLKRLEDAIKDNDTIYAVIRGCGINNDGSDKLGYTAPSINGQIDCIKLSLNQAHVPAESIGFIEAHGTATSLGDVIEFSALNKAYKCYTNKTSYCALGSVKSNIGHTDIAAGMAGLIKAILSIYYKKIPPTLHFKRPNPNIDLANSPFYINTQLSNWHTSSIRYAGISAFGIGGTNAHIILEEYTQGKSESSTLVNKLLVLSAKTQDSLSAYTDSIIEHLNTTATTKNVNYLYDMAYTLQIGRDDFLWRKIAVGKDVSELIRSLTNHSPILCEKHPKSIVFMFSGQGSQYPKMAMELFDSVPYFASILLECNNLVKLHLNCDLLAIIRNNNSHDTLINETQYTQPALFIIEYALAKLLIFYGITPQAMIGHSNGEYVAACIANVFSLEDAIKLICKRGMLMAKAPRGSMLAIECTSEEFFSITQGIAVDLALHNSTHNCIASGSNEAIAQLQQTLNDSKLYPYQRLKVSHAFHSRLMENLHEEFKSIFKDGIVLHEPKIPIISNLTGKWLNSHEATSAEYWYQHMRHTVQFKQGIEFLLNDEYTSFIEVGVGNTSSSFIQEISRKNAVKVNVIHTLPNHKKMVEDEQQLLLALGTLWQNGYKINWSAFYGDEKRRRVPLPTYRFQRQHYWVEGDYEPIMSNSTDINSWFYSPSWNHGISYRNNICVSENIKNYVWLIFKGRNRLSEDLVATLQKLEVKLIVVEGGDAYKMFNAKHYTIKLSEKEHYFNLFSDLKNYIDKPIIILHLFSCINFKNKLLNNQEIDHMLDYGFYSVLFMLQGYIEYFGSEEELKCGIITDASQQVTGAEKLNPINATLTGMCRVVAQEYEKLQLNLIDIDGNEPYDVFLPTAIVNYCVSKWVASCPIRAFRNGYQWDLTYSNLQLTESINRFRNNGVYLCTGGLGGISLTLCKAIATLVRAPIFVLVSRAAMPPREEWNSILNDISQNKLHQSIRSVQMLEASGAELCFEQGDITDSLFLKETVTKITSKYGQINGVIHAAGISGGGIIQKKDKASAYKVFASKLHGTYNLAQVLQEHRLDFVMLCSSLSALVDEAGQSDYCGANSCLDAISMSGLFNSNFTVSINWNTWENIGMAVNTERPDDITFLDVGNSITPEQGQYLFKQVMQSKYPQLAISKFNIANYKDIAAKCKKLKLPPTIKRDSLITNAQYKAPNTQIEKQLVSLWQEILGIENIGINDDFFTLGGHSLKALKFIELVGNKLNKKLALQDLYEAKTIANISGIIGVVGAEQSNTIRLLRSVPNSKINLFLFHPVAGTAFCYKNILDNLNVRASIYGIEDPSIFDNRMKFATLLDMAKYYLQCIKIIQPVGTYYFIGYSFGGTVAYEVANLLHYKYKALTKLIMIDGWAIFSKAQYDEKIFKYLLQHYNKDMSEEMLELCWQRMLLLLQHKPSITKQDIILFKATKLLEEYQDIDDKYNGWAAFSSGRMVLYELEETHGTITSQEASVTIAQEVQKSWF